MLLAYRHLPLESIHPLALGAAQAAECARRQGRFWEMHDRLLQVGRTIDGGDFSADARAIGLDAEVFGQCLSAADVMDAIRRDTAEAKKLKISGTPTFLLGAVLPDGRVKVTHRVFGARAAAEFESLIEGLLNAEPVTKGR